MGATRIERERLPCSVAPPARPVRGGSLSEHTGPDLGPRVWPLLLLLAMSVSPDRAEAESAPRPAEAEASGQESSDLSVALAITASRTR